MTDKQMYSSLQAADDGLDRTSQEHSLTQEKRRSSTTRWTSWTEDGWFWELLSLCIGCILFLALCLVLNGFNNASTPYLGGAFGGALTINTIVAVIGAAIQASFLFPTIECLSQLKWQYMQKQARQLHDLSVFDKASRGVLGAIAFLWKIKLGSFASCGSVLIILAITLNPFFQQLIAIQQEERLPTDHISFATTSYVQQWWDAVSGPQAASIVLASESQYFAKGPSTSMKSAILGGLFVQNETTVPIAPACPSGNCTFAPYLTLAVCASFVDLSSNVQQGYTSSTSSSAVASTTSTNAFQQGQSRSLSNKRSPTDLSLLPTIGRVCTVGEHAYLNTSTSAVMNVTAMETNTSIAFANVTAPLIDVVILEGGSTSSDQCSAYEFVLEWCVQNQTTSVTRGVSVTHISNIYPDWITSGSGDDAKLGPFNVTLDSQHFYVEEATHVSLRRYFAQLFNGTVNIMGIDKFASSDVMQRLYEPLGFGPVNVSSVENAAHNMATSMTNRIRQPNLAAFGTTPPALYAEGAVYEMTSIVVVRWKWITLPLVFAVGSVAFVLITIFTSRSSRGGHLWKSSSLALACSMDPALNQGMDGLSKPSQLKDQSQQVKVQLRQDHRGGQWRMMQIS